MKIVCVPLCAASLAVYVMFLGFDNMDQVHASWPHGDDCVSVNFTMAANECKYKNRSLFTLSDLKTSRGGRFVRNVTTFLKEIWIRGDENGSCQTYRFLPTKGSANKTGDDLKFLRTNCSDQHHYVCIQNATKSDLEPQYHPACYEKTSSGPEDKFGRPVVYSLVIATGCLVIALAIGIIAVHVISKRKTNVQDSGTTSQAGDAQHTGSNPEGDNGCGLQTEDTEADNDDRLTAVEFHVPEDAEYEPAVVVVRCKDPADVDSLEASPSDVTY